MKHLTSVSVFDIVCLLNKVKGKISVDKVERAFIKSEAYKRALSDYRLANEGFEWNKGELGDFLSELFVKSSGGSVKASDIHELYTKWASVNEKPALSQRSLGMKLRKNLETKRMSDGIYYLGIEVRGFGRPIYSLVNKETNETNGEYYDKDGLIKFVQDYWILSNEGQELPGRLRKMTMPEVKKELVGMGVRVESDSKKDVKFRFITK